MIPKATIDSIREKADILAIIGEQVSLKKRGKNFLGLCPFHSEKTPSFTVSPEKHLWHCFGCGEGGNIFDFIMKAEKVDFAEAVRLLADKIGIEIEAQSAQSREASSRKARIYGALERACKFFEAALDEQAGQDFLKARKIAPETARIFRLGITSSGWDPLFKHLISKGVAPQDLESAGLCIPREQQGDYFDRFRSRFMFPIIDGRGKVAGFSGRALKDEEPKYLNSPDTPVFNKGLLLYGLHSAVEEIKKNKFAILVEGNVDLIAVYQAGYKNVVAPLGTSFTLNQARLLTRLAPGVVTMFDADSAGVNAALKAGEVLRQAGIAARVGVWEAGQGKDPDEFIQKHGADAFWQVVKNSVPALEFSIKQAAKKYNLKNREARVRAAHEVVAVLARENDQILQKEYLKAAAGWLMIEEETLRQELRRLQGSPARHFGNYQRRVTEKPPVRVEEAEKCLLALALESTEARERIKEKILPQEMATGIFQKIFELLLSGTLEESADEEQKKLIRSVVIATPALEDRAATLEDCLEAIKEYSLKNQISDLRQKMENAEKTGDLEGLKKLQQEYHKLSEIIRARSR